MSRFEEEPKTPEKSAAKEIVDLTEFLGLPKDRALDVYGALVGALITPEDGQGILNEDLHNAMERDSTLAQGFFKDPSAADSYILGKIVDHTARTLRTGREIIALTIDSDTTEPGIEKPS